MIINSFFRKLNGHDNLYITIDGMLRDREIIEEYREDGNKEGYHYLRVYSDGTASFGYFMYRDPSHDNGPYTWSSNSEDINDVFNLRGSTYQVIECTITQLGDSTGFAGAILASVAFSISKAFGFQGMDKDLFGVINFSEYLGRPYTIEVVRPYIEEDMLILPECIVDHDVHFTKVLLKNNDSVYMRTNILADLFLKRYGMWSRNAYTNIPISLNKEEMKKRLKDGGLPF